ncbi:unnamed protein product [Cercospora beticola]|nr:unnamed protein product [Cercospora beticola]
MEAKIDSIDEPSPCPTTEELDQIWRWNAEVHESISACVHDKIAANKPDALAVHAWDGDLTYAQLNAFADQLASKWACVGMLAVIKAGCAAVTLDANHPDARLRSIVEQLQPSLLVCSAGHQERALGLGVEEVVLIDENCFETRGGLDDESPSLPKVSPTDIVYISFTSGTTGQPKGACVSHANVCSTVYYQGRKLGFNEQSRVLDIAPYSFDVAWSNFMHTLCAGGCLCIAKEEDILNDLSSVIRQFQPTLINVTPTVLRTIQSPQPTLETILLSGEMPYGDNITRWADQVRLLNTYGPTECTFKCAFSVLDATSADRPDLGVGVGFSTWIVSPNDASQLAAPGSVGELYLEGPMVGQGYLADAEKTSLSFIVDPPWLLAGSQNVPGRSGCVYKTGDLVKYLSDGRLLFVGRVQGGQLKIRGQRVELGDVEYYVRTCLGNELAVIVDAIYPSDRDAASLAVFVETSGQDLQKIHDRLSNLQQKICEILPLFMIPSVFFPVNEFPVAATGKLDRKRL